MSDRSATFEVVVRVHLTNFTADLRPTIRDAAVIVSNIIEGALEDSKFWNGAGLECDSFVVESEGTKYATEVK